MADKMNEVEGKNKIIGADPKEEKSVRRLLCLAGREY
jgi:hypothetical protein